MKNIQQDVNSNMLYTSKELSGCFIDSKPSNKNSDIIDVRCKIGSQENVNNENTKVFTENCKENIAPLNFQGIKIIFIFSYKVTITKYTLII